MPKKAFVSLWDAESWTLVKTRTVCQKPVTCFEISEDGERLAYGGSDLSVGVLDARTLRVRFVPFSLLLPSGSDSTHDTRSQSSRSSTRTTSPSRPSASTPPALS